MTMLTGEIKLVLKGTMLRQICHKFQHVFFLSVCCWTVYGCLVTHCCVCRYRWQRFDWSTLTLSQWARPCVFSRLASCSSPQSLAISECCCRQCRPLDNGCRGYYNYYCYNTAELWLNWNASKELCLFPCNHFNAKCRFVWQQVIVFVSQNLPLCGVTCYVLQIW